MENDDENDYNTTVNVHIYRIGKTLSIIETC